MSADCSDESKQRRGSSLFSLFWWKIFLRISLWKLFIVRLHRYNSLIFNRCFAFYLKTISVYFFFLPKFPHKPHRRFLTILLSTYVLIYRNKRQLKVRFFPLCTECFFPHTMQWFFLLKIKNWEFVFFKKKKN